MKFILLLSIVAVLANFQVVVAAPAWEWLASLKSDAQIGEMRRPTALFIDYEKERYYVVDSGNNRLISFDKSGKMLSSFNVNQSLDAPVDMIRDAAGFLWVIERGRNTITKIDLKTKTVNPVSLKINDHQVYPDRLEQFGDKLYVIDRATGNILLLNQDALFEKNISCAECKSGFTDFRISSSGEIWALGQAEKALYHFTNKGEFDKKIFLLNKELFPVSFDIDSSGFFYVADRFSGSIVVFDQDGQVKYSFLGWGQVRGRLAYPIELRFDPWGRLCVVDEGNGRVEIFGR